MDYTINLSRNSFNPSFKTKVQKKINGFPCLVTSFIFQIFLKLVAKRFPFKSSINEDFHLARS